MKRKYYMRGLGIGIIVTALVCAFAFSKDSPAMTDDEIIARAKQLGYIKKEEAVTAEDINKIKENEKETGRPEVSPEATPQPTKEPTIEAPLPPDEPGQPTPVTEHGNKSEGAKTPSPKATQVPKETMPPEPIETPAATSTPVADAYTVVVERGMTARRVAEQLESLGVVASAEDFVKYLMEKKLTDFINVGRFTIPSGASYEEIGRILTK